MPLSEHQNEKQIDSKRLVDIFVEKLHSVFGMDTNAVTGAVQGRLEHDQRQIERVATEMRKLDAAYNRYLDLERELRLHERSIEKLQVLLAGVYVQQHQGYKLLAYPKRAEQMLPVLERARKLRGSLELWELIEQVLRFVPEARLNDLVEFLSVARVRKTSRQAIEACIRAHPKVFSAKISKHVKYVSLKQRF